MAYKAYRSSILFPVFLLSLPSVTLSRVNQVFCLLAGTRHRLLVDPEAAPGKLPTPATLDVTHLYLLFVSGVATTTTINGEHLPAQVSAVIITR